MPRSGKEILDKIKKMKSLKTDTALAKLFNVKRNTVSTWRKRGVPYEQIIAICDREGIPIGTLLAEQATLEHAEAEHQKGFTIADGTGTYQEDQSDTIKISEDLILATRVLESSSVYAAALHLNIRSFARAIDTEERASGGEAAQRQLELLQIDNGELRKEVDRLKTIYEKHDGANGHVSDHHSKE